MKNSFILKCGLAISISIAAVACIKNVEEPPVGCEPAPVIVLPLNVLDASTGQDLFFSASPRYQTTNLYFFNKKDLNRKDTIRATVAAAGINCVFLVPITNAVTKDTLLMKIGNNADDIIIYSIINVPGECSYLKLDKVLINGTALEANQGRYNFLK